MNISNNIDSLCMFCMYFEHVVNTKNLSEISFLIQIEKHKNMNCIDVREILMDMRQYRMGLIQTADQLRFSYQAIIQGGHAILNQSNGLDLPMQLVSVDIICVTRSPAYQGKVREIIFYRKVSELCKNCLSHGY